MNNILFSPISHKDIQTSSSGVEKKTSESFSQVMTDVIGQSNYPKNSAENVKSTILIGKISNEIPTVSELLSQNKELTDSTWDIIYSEQNKNKDYTKILPGTSVYYSPEDGAITWSGADSTSTPSNSSNKIIDSQSISPLEPVIVQHESVPQKELTTLGKIDSANPTVSHLLKNQPGLKDQMWQLLGDKINKDKPYDRIAAGTEIQFNPVTKEIIWSDKTTVTAVAKAIPTAVENLPVITTSTAEQLNQIPNNLSEAVQGYKGISYDKINCYELLVKGLNDLNIAYTGKNGLYSKLTNMATEKGLASNAYLNGEGIVKAAGSKLYSKNYSNISDWKNKAEALIEEIEPILGSGQILSFSTEKRGHTGIVGRKDSQWTFINSGRMDNSVDKQTISMGVGEEVLNKEIGNWFKSAQQKGETLSVTLGQLDQGRIQTASNMYRSYTNQI